MISAYLSWHYGAAIRQAGTIAGNFIAFAIHLFSMKELAASLFSPWRRISENAEGSGLSGIFMAIWDNAISRVLGAFARLVLLTMGFIFLVLTSMVSLAMVVAWIIGPVIPVAFFALGVMLLIPSSPF